jgi:hypothetical protein
MHASTNSQIQAKPRERGKSPVPHAQDNARSNGQQSLPRSRSPAARTNTATNTVVTHRGHASNSPSLSNAAEASEAALPQAAPHAPHRQIHEAPKSRVRTTEPTFNPFSLLDEEL